ncbi:MAG: hypothetical protein HC884_16530 [Chloroflexaceae bacterium]|nr:hypothetical protein [Chloroflexaceae bacterium]
MKMNSIGRRVLLTFVLLVCLWLPWHRTSTAQTGDDRWVSIGPQRDAVDILLADPSTPATLYAAALGSGVFKSGDGGNTWRSINTGLTSLEVSALAAAPTTPTTLYAGTTVRGYLQERRWWRKLATP